MALPDPHDFSSRFAADQSDLTVAILGASYLDALLEDLLRTYLVQSREAKELFGQTFTRKARIAFALGLVSRDTLDDLGAIADVRNYFAHRVLVESASFNDPEMAEVCRRLSSARQAKEPENREFLEAMGYDLDSPRADYIEALTACASEIVSRREHSSFTPLREASEVRRVGLLHWTLVLEIVARLRVKDAEADRRRRLNVWVIATLADPQFVDSPVGPWTQGGCYLLALAIRDALAVHGVASELAEYKPPNHSGSQHVAVAMGPTRLDAYGAWLAAVPPAALAGWTESLLDAAKAAGWGSPFDDETFRARLTKRLVDTFPPAAPRS